MIPYRYFYCSLLCYTLMALKGTGDTETSDTDFADCSGDVDYIEDGRCDISNNNERCGYDGGDCCECTCKDGLDYPCGESGVGFLCKDPNTGCLAGNAPTATPSDTPVAFMNPTMSPTESVYPACDGITVYINDGICDDVNNNAACDFDGGDCCPCTCGAIFGCGTQGFDCLDPGAPRDCFPDTPAPVLISPTNSPGSIITRSPSTNERPTCTGQQTWVSNGACDAINNNMECNYDGGDCCECTCISSYFVCGDFDCVDPSARNGCSTASPTPSLTSQGGTTAPLVVAIADEYVKPSSGLSPGYVALAAIGFFLFVGGIVGGVIFFYRRDRRVAR